MGLLQSASKTALGFSIIFGVLLGVTFPFLTPGTGSYVVAVLTIVPIVLLFLASVAVILTGWDPI